MDATKLLPLGDRVLVRLAKSEDTSKGEIVIPDAAKKKPEQGTVLTVGPGRDYTRIPLAVTAGDVVLFTKSAGTPVGEESEGLVILDAGDLLAVEGREFKDVEEMTIAADGSAGAIRLKAPPAQVG